MLEIIAVSSGLLIRGAGWVNTAEGGLPWRGEWCPCVGGAWSEPEARCWDSELVVEWPCGVPVRLRILLLPESELNPVRTEVLYSLAEFQPPDIDLDGRVSRRDIVAYAGDPYDWNGDGVVNDLPLILLRIEQGC